MDLYAIFITSAVAAVVGIVLYLPFFIWFRWKSSKSRSGVLASTHVTASGFVLHALILVILLGGLAVGQILPQSWLGAQVSTLFGGFGYVVTVSILMSMFERFLVKRGCVFSYRKAIQATEEHKTTSESSST
jgi:hypothetical protein